MKLALQVEPRRLTQKEKHKLRDVFKRLEELSHLNGVAGTLRVSVGNDVAV